MPVRSVLGFCALLLFTVGIPTRAQLYENPRMIQAPQSPTKVMAADLNNDGRIDIVYGLPAVPTRAGSIYSSGVALHILLRQADDTYLPAPTVVLPKNTAQCLIADVNRDGVADILCSNTGNLDSGIATVLGNGDGTFRDPVFSPVQAVGAGPTSYLPYSDPLAAGDLDGDGIPDLVVNGNNYYSSSVIFMRGDATGRFVAQGSMQTPTPTLGVTLLDLNGDGILDMKVLGGDPITTSLPTGYPGSGDVLYFGVGHFTFGQGQTLPTNGILQDVDGDGHVDFVGGNAGRLQILHGNPDGSFDLKHPLADQTFPPPAVRLPGVANLTGILAYRDLDGDGIADILVGGGDGMTVLRGQPGYRFTVAGHYLAAQDFVNGPSLRSGLVVDLNGDGNLDFLAAGPQGIYLTYGLANGTFVSPGIYESGNGVFVGTVADFNGDGVPDVLTAGTDGFHLRVGTGDGTFTPAVLPAGLPTALVNSSVWNFLVHGDFNGDGKQDILMPCSAGSCVYLGKGDGTFTGPVAGPPHATLVTQAHVRDFNNDGRDDLSYTYIDDIQQRSATAIANPDGTFKEVETDFQGGVWAFGDMDGDGILDLVAAAKPNYLGLNTSVDIYSGSKDGRFYLMIAGAPISAQIVTSIAVGDFDGNGTPDLAILGFTADTSLNIIRTPQLTRVYNEGKHHEFSPGVVTTPALFATSLFAADLNGDHRDDLFYLSTFGDSSADGGVPAISYLLGNADRSVSDEHFLVSGNLPLTPFAVDVNRDGKLDLVTPNLGGGETDNTFTVLLNNLGLPTVIGALTATPEPSIIHNSFTLSALLRPPASSATAVLQGTVAFSIDGQPIGTAPLLANTATLTASPTLFRGQHTLSAVWAGQAAVAASGAHAATPAFGAVTLNGTHVVLGVASSTTLTASATSVAANTPISLTAATTEQGGTAPDLTKLQILDGTIPLQSAIAGNTIVSTVTLAPGTHTLTAVFAGDTVAEPSTSAPVTVTVAPYPTTLAAPAATGIAFHDTPLPAIAQFNPVPATPPGGTVVFSTGTVALGSAPLTAPANTATLTVNLPAGTYPIHAVYTPAASGQAPAAADGTLTLARAPVSLVLTSPAPTPIPPSKTSTFTATFNDGTNRHLATGTIVPVIDSQPQAPLALSPDGNLTYTVGGLTPGDHTIALTYAGDSNFLPATTAPATLTVLNRDFILSGDTTLTVQTQHYRSLAVRLTSIGDFAGTVALSCANLPPNATCRFSRAPVGLTATAAADVTLTIDTSALPGYMAANLPARAQAIVAAALAPIGLLLFARRRNLPRLLALLALAAAVGLTGCSGLYPAATPPGTYTFQVVGQSADTGGTSAALTHSRDITLVVTP